MVKPVFFVQNNYVERLTVPVARFARAREIDLVDRSSGSSFDADACGVDWSEYDLILPYGSVQFIRQCKPSSVGPFILHDERRFAAAKWMPILGKSALNSGGRLSSVAELMDDFGAGPLHLRPDSVDKAFVGGVHTLDSFAAIVGDRKLAGDLQCWVSPLREIVAEWRCWVIAGDIVEISQYRRDGALAVQRETSPDLIEQASELAGIYVPAPCVVMDIAMTTSGYAVIEYNPIHCSGWYAANVDHVLDAWLRWAIKNQTRPPAPASADQIRSK